MQAVKLLALLFIFLAISGVTPAAAAGAAQSRHAPAQLKLRGSFFQLGEDPDPTPEDITRGLFNTWNAALATLDPKKVTALYTTNAVLVPTLSNTPRNTPELIEDYFRHFLRKRPHAVLNETFPTQVALNAMVNSGVYTFMVTNLDGSRSALPARFTFVYVRSRNRWLIKEHHSSAMPQPKLPTTEEIASLFDTWNAALATLDPKKVAALYTKDAVLLPTVSNKVRDTPELIEDYFEDFLEKKPVGVVDSSNTTVLSPTLGARAGIYTFTLHGKDGSTSIFQARFSFLYRKEGGKWLIAQHHSSAMPEQQLPTEAEIHQLFVGWNTALQTKNPEAVADLYATNNSILLPTLANMVADTREEKVEYFKHFLAKSPVGVINEEHIQLLSPTLAANSGIYTFTLTADGKTSQVQARYTFVYSKVGGQWKIIDHHSSLMPEH